MGESRTELLAWLNDLLQLNYTKVEQVGTGAAYCQIMDSVFNDVGMTKVKFDTKHEYEYVANYKVLQHTFDKHKIDKVNNANKMKFKCMVDTKPSKKKIIPVDKLIKCKFQDNLEFLQWVKRFWDQNFPGGEYDAPLRRKGGGAITNTSARTTGRSTVGGASVARKAVNSSGKLSPNYLFCSIKPSTARSANRTPTSASTGGRLSSAKSANSAALDNQSAAVISEMNKQITELKVTVDGLEKERDFYFGKLREIEIMVQEQLDLAEANGQQDLSCFRDIQAVLYQTEEGFEVPPEGEEVQDDYDDETF
ncbi:Microtubule-associated protein RP/EB family member 3 [Choanephora cucurbitarum]|uniref:Microtubule-associated protein RP/EB family member 3 n=1 Tax=Choanephora cucurbitarum TaxID=101091 RepID=A0A1C7N3M3_9FUNG|nr:Microtubule-associated protein RP/EB family member 3 [Choanephora cucurbitarum]